MSSIENVQFFNRVLSDSEIKSAYERNTFVRQYIQDHITTQWKVYFDCIQDILDAADLITTAFKSGNKLLLCGNGGSAADCQHLSTELMSGTNSKVLPSIALTTDTSFITAYSNDFDFNNIFERQVYGLGKSGDVLLAISTSGKSLNIRTGVAAAHDKDMKVITLTGENGVDGPVDIAIKVPSSNTQHVQESHITIEHILWKLVVEEIGV